MHLPARSLAGDPLGLSIARGYAAIQRGGHLQNHIGSVSTLPDQKIRHQITAFRFADRAQHFHPGFAQAGRASGGQRVGIGQPHDHPADARIQNGLCARRRLALVVAGLQRDHQGAAFGVHAARSSVFQTVHFSVILPGLMVPAARHNAVVTRQNRAHSGIGARFPAPLFRQGNGLAHEGSEILLSHGAVLLSWRQACR